MSVAFLAVTLALGSFTEGRGNLVQTQPERSARLLDAELESSARPSESAVLRLLDGTFLGQARLPRLDDGGADTGTRQILSLVLGFFPGFGLGHLVARDRDGFILFLIIDLALYAGGVVVGSVLGSGLFWGLGGLVWLVVHIFQALDAYARSGGERLVQRARDQAVLVASASGRTAPLDPAAVTTRLLGLSF